MGDLTDGTTLPASGGMGSGTEDVLGRGALVGRYVVLGRLGAGGMGVVYSAYDPELARRVALKLLLPGGSGDAARVRLQREAQAMAQLTHPNVATVHDVGVHDENVYVAMEFVDGETVYGWMRPTRPWREVARVFIEAGRGLAAAHAAGLLHRDVKPSNVMIGKDGRVLVMDFGLASASGAAETPAFEDSAVDIDATALVTRLTQTGALLGSPAYMSPEQFRGGTLDSKTDQFSLCVSLYEALYGARPFSAESLVDLVHAVSEGHVDPAPPAPYVPSCLRRVVLRGLSPKREDRFESMEQLVAALADDPAVRRRRWYAAAGAALVVAGGAAAVRKYVDRRPQLCRASADKLAGVWDDARREEVRNALLGTGVPYAETTSALVRDGLDKYAEQWTHERDDACAATQVRGEQSADMLDLRMRCYDQRLDRVRGLLDILVAADATVMEKVTEAVASLPGLNRCSDTDALSADVEPPEDPETAAAVDGLSARLEDAAAHELTAR